MEEEKEKKEKRGKTFQNARKNKNEIEIDQIYLRTTSQDRFKRQMSGGKSTKKLEIVEFWDDINQRVIRTNVFNPKRRSAEVVVRSMSYEVAGGSAVVIDAVPYELVSHLMHR